MGFWGSLISGKPDPIIDSALRSEQTFAVDTESVDPSLFGLTSYVNPVAPAARVDRRTAMSVPAVKRSRDLIAGTLGGLPLNLFGPDKRDTDSTFLSQPEKDCPRSVTLTRTAEDLLFEGIAWWRITEFAWTTYPARVKRLDPRTVTVNDADGTVYVNGKQVADNYLIRFDSPCDPLLTSGARAIRTALALDAAASRYADEPQPLGYFSPSDGADPADDEDVTDLLNAWQTARQTRATGYVPASLKYNQTGFNPEELQLADARQHAVLEIARLTGIDPEDLGVSTTSRTYQNSQDRRKALLDFVLGPYRQAIEDRLSMGDVTPRGYFVKFNLSAFLRSDDKTRMETYEIASRVGALTVPEIRELEDRPALPEGTQPVPAPIPTEAATVETVQKFDAEKVLTFDAPSSPETFSVDRETRTIRGLAVPFGVVSNDGRVFSFSKGSITFTDPGRIKLLVAHDWSQAIGRATAIEETDEGLVAAFKVARGPEGDRALSMAEDGVWDGLSVGIGKGMKTVLRDGVQHVTSAPLREISQTPCPAYDGARITEVAASADMEGTEMDPENTPSEVQDFSALTGAITAAFEGLSVPQRETVSAGGSLEITEPSPYRFDGAAGSHSFVDDLRAANFGDTEARQRIDVFTDQAFAVTTGNTGTLNPTQNRPDLYVPNLTFTRPLWESVSNGVVNDKTPFTIPKFSSATGLVSSHTEGVEPTPGAFSATSQTVTPTPVSGKIEINREVLDQGGSPQADAIVWGEMQNAYYEAIEAKIASTLGAVPTAEVNFAGVTDKALVIAMENILIGLQFARGGNRYSRLVLDGTLFPALVGASDTTGRKFLPVLGATNADGQVSAGFDSVSIGNLTGRAAWALGAGNAAKSYLFVPSSVWAWASAPKKFVFEYQVKSVDLAIWGYSASAVLRDSDVKPLDYTTADV